MFESLGDHSIADAVINLCNTIERIREKLLEMLTSDGDEDTNYEDLLPYPSSMQTIKQKFMEKYLSDQKQRFTDFVCNAVQSDDFKPFNVSNNVYCTKYVIDFFNLLGEFYLLLVKSPVTNSFMNAKETFAKVCFHSC